MAGGIRKGAGRKCLKKGSRRESHNVRLDPMIVHWLKSMPRGKATETIERLLKAEKEMVEHDTKSV